MYAPFLCETKKYPHTHTQREKVLFPFFDLWFPFLIRALFGIHYGDLHIFEYTYETTRLKTAQQQYKIHRRHQILTNSLLNEWGDPNHRRSINMKRSIAMKNTKKKTIENNSHRATYFDFVTTNFSSRIRIMQSLLGEIESAKKWQQQSYCLIRIGNEVNKKVEKKHGWISFIFDFYAGCWLMPSCWVMTLCVNANKQR